jgi:hypothetical protein
MAVNLHLIEHKTNTLHMLELDWTVLQQGFRLILTIITIWLAGL